MTDELGIKLVGESWYRRLKKVMNSDEFTILGKTLNEERKKTIIYPDKDNVFKCFKLTSFDDVKIVILGQDVYHDGNATGLAFANDNSKIVPSPSLRIISKEVENDVYDGLNFDRILNWDLTHWASQGVLLLNTALTVRKGEPGSHISMWSFFIDEVIKQLDYGHSGLIWMLWGNHAKKYKDKIHVDSHHILEAGHPASACYGKDSFSGCKHFSKANQFLGLMNGDNAKIYW